jgi:predicted nucleotide-binding protein
VFVVRADDLGRHISEPRKPLTKMPRGNVLLEFGLVAGRLGRRNVAICRFGGVELPSDLASMTVIDMKKTSGKPPWTKRLKTSFDDGRLT